MTTHLVNIFPSPFLFKPNLQLHLLKPRSSSFPQTPTLALSNPNDLPYGPFSSKGQTRNLYPHESLGNDHPAPVINKESFIRVYDISAIKVSAEECFRLESRIRGHLLNWPCVRNIARVDGDEVKGEYREMLPMGRAEGEETFRSYENENENEVLYRDKLASTFNARGYMKFRNLAKLSRPKKKKKGLRKYEGSGVGVEGRKDFAVVEVVGEVDEEDMSGLLGKGFKGGEGGKWRGSTRLLFLDERS